MRLLYATSHGASKTLSFKKISDDQFGVNWLSLIQFNTPMSSFTSMNDWHGHAIEILTEYQKTDTHQMQNEWDQPSKAPKFLSVCQVLQVSSLNVRYLNYINSYFRKRCVARGPAASGLHSRQKCSDVTSLRKCDWWLPTTLPFWYMSSWFIT